MTESNSRLGDAPSRIRPNGSGAEDRAVGLVLHADEKQIAFTALMGEQAEDAHPPGVRLAFGNAHRLLPHEPAFGQFQVGGLGNEEFVHARQIDLGADGIDAEVAQFIEFIEIHAALDDFSGAQGERLQIIAARALGAMTRSSEDLIRNANHWYCGVSESVISRPVLFVTVTVAMTGS